jgi:adenylate kinase family enzyme
VRISIVGTSGSGKSTVGRAAAARLDVPFTELDGIRHQANWVELPDDEFQARVAEVVAGDGWVVDGNYAAVRPLVRDRATAIVWLDLPRWLVMAQVSWRSLSRALLRRELWNGNREQFRRWLAADHPIRWAWSTYGRRKQEFESQMDGRWVRLGSRREVRQWLASLERGTENDAARGTAVW